MTSDEVGELRDWAPSAPTEPQYLQKSRSVCMNNKHKLRVYCVYNTHEGESNENVKYFLSRNLLNTKGTQ